MSKSKSARSTSAEELCSSDTRNPKNNLLKDILTIVCKTTPVNFDTIDLVPGEIYYDFSGLEIKRWYKLQVDDAVTQFDWSPAYGWTSKEVDKVSNMYGQPLLYLGHKPDQDMTISGFSSSKTLCYFLAENQVVGLEISSDGFTADSFIRLWPHVEARLHKNIYYTNKK